MDTDGIHEGFQSVMETGVDVFNRRLFWLQMRWRDEALRLFIKVDDDHFFCKRCTFDVLRAVFLVRAAGTIERVDVLAIVLDTRAVDVDGRAMDLVDGLDNFHPSCLHR